MQRIESLEKQIASHEAFGFLSPLFGIGRNLFCPPVMGMAFVHEDKKYYNLQRLEKLSDSQLRQVILHQNIAMSLFNGHEGIQANYRTNPNAAKVALSYFINHHIANLDNRSGFVSFYPGSLLKSQYYSMDELMAELSSSMVGETPMPVPKSSALVFSADETATFEAINSQLSHLSIKETPSQQARALHP